LSAKSRRKSTNSHRCQLDVIADILEASNKGAKKTYLMYHCNMSFRQVKHYLNLLLKKKLIRVTTEEGHNPSIFKITDKGMRFLRAYRDLRALME
jgi:predicted transcriptional regulator